MIANLVLEDDVQSVNESGKVSENGEKDVNDQMRAASLLDKHTDWLKIKHF